MQRNNYHAQERRSIAIDHYPHHPEDRSHARPEQEHLQPGEIDLTGVVRQDEALGDVIHDALSETEPAGELPTWGARAIARTLANDFPQTAQALHHFAVTGRADHPRMHSELATIYAYLADDDDARTWISWLSAHLATMAEPVTPQRESEASERTTPDSPAPTPHYPNLAEIDQGIREHGTAFRAYLCLPDIGIDQPEPLRNFQRCYVGNYASMQDIIDQFTSARDCLTAVTKTAERFGLAEFIYLDYHQLAATIRETWSIIEADGRLYVFNT